MPQSANHLVKAFLLVYAGLFPDRQPHWSRADPWA